MFIIQEVSYQNEELWMKRLKMSMSEYNRFMFSKDNEETKVEGTQKGYFSFFSNIFKDNNSENEISVTAIATNGKSVILGYSNGTCGVYVLDKNGGYTQESLHQLSTSGQPVNKLEVHFMEFDDKELKITVLISQINGIVKWWNYDNISLYTRFNVDGVLDFSFTKNKS